MGSFVYYGGLNPGSQTITATGAGSFTVPAYTSKLRVRGWGAGAGGVGHNGSVGVAGGNGGATTFSAPGGTLTAGGGTGGTLAYPSNALGGTASGGDINTSGQTGGVDAGSNKGGNAANTAQGGGTGGAAPGANGPGNNGNSYGGGGSGARTSFGGWMAGGGGAFVEKVYLPGDLSAGSTVSYSVGAKGVGGNSNLYDGGNGADGALVIEWDYE